MTPGADIREPWFKGRCLCGLTKRLPSILALAQDTLPSQAPRQSNDVRNAGFNSGEENATSRSLVRCERRIIWSQKGWFHCRPFYLLLVCLKQVIEAQ